jgi:hypothetical protein
MEGPRIQVIVRKRPLTSKELRKSEYDIIDVTSACELIVKEEK